MYERDDEAYNIWANEVGVPLERIVRIGDNEAAPSLPTTSGGWVIQVRAARAPKSLRSRRSQLG
ncbi:hypothetical protein ACNKHM_19585 [Shigella sonnei]